MDRELYDKISRLLTWYEHPEESSISEKELNEEMYHTMVEVQNAMAEYFGF